MANSASSQHPRTSSSNGSKSPRGSQSRSAKNTGKKLTKSVVRLRIAVIVVAVVIVLSLVAAFIWPGWAIRSTENTPLEVTSNTASPSVSASALPDSATTLLKSMPDSVSNFARISAESATTWQSTEPLEEYTVVYSNGTKADNVTITVAQWSDSTNAATQYDTLTKAITGESIASGNIKVDGEKTGEYVVAYASATDTNNAVAYWYNDSVLFAASGATDAVTTVFEYFPM